MGGMKSPLGLLNCQVKVSSSIYLSSIRIVLTKVSFPDKWKMANVIPIHKYDNNYLLNGNKVKLYFTEMISGYFIFRVQRGHINISLDHRGEIK